MSALFICTFWSRKWSVPVQSTARPLLSWKTVAEHINYYAFCYKLGPWQFLPDIICCFFLKDWQENTEILESLHLFTQFQWPDSHLTVDGSLQLRVAGFIELDSWKEVLDQAQEERLVLVDLNKHTQHTENRRGGNPTIHWMLIIVVQRFYK